MSTLLILGAGQYGQVVKEIAFATGRYDKIDFVDDNSPNAIGKLSQIFTVEYDEAIVAIGNPLVRKEWAEKIERLATLVHPLAVIAPSAKVGKGCIVEAGAVISSNASLEEGTIVMANAVVGHNAKVGAYCKVKYNATIFEGCEVPPLTQVESNSVYGK